MDASHITPFIESTKNVFSTMLKLQVSVGKPYMLDNLQSRYDISGIIGMSGDVVGMVVLSFPSASAAAVVSKFVGNPVSVDSDDFADAVGELVNMVSGAAKAKFEGKSVSISCPSVVIGPNHKVAQPSDTTCICIPCTSACGEFSLDVAIRDAMRGQRSAAVAAAAKA
jgi:chemotaxis protein CheX